MPNDPPPTAQLSPERFRQLAVAELDAVHRFASHLCRDAQEAEDLVQQAYLRAFESWTTFRLGASGMRPWLFKILHNVHRGRARGRREPLRLDDARDVETGQERSGEIPLGAGVIDWEQVDQRLKRAVLDLSDDLRTVFLLYAADDLKYREIAEILQIPLGTVMSRLSRARGLILGRLAAADGTPGNKAGGARIVEKEERRAQS